MSYFIIKNVLFSDLFLTKKYFKAVIVSPVVSTNSFRTDYFSVKNAENKRGLG